MATRKKRRGYADKVKRKRATSATREPGWMWWCEGENPRPVRMGSGR